MSKVIPEKIITNCSDCDTHKENLIGFSWRCMRESSIVKLNNYPTIPDDCPLKDYKPEQYEDIVCPACNMLICQVPTIPEPQEEK